jgi:malate dehydrogenase (oxaloacetate-decarboxylating)
LSRRIVCIDSQGLILRDRHGLHGHKLDLAADPEIVKGWGVARGSGLGLLDVVRHFRPTILIGASGRPGAFTEDVVRTMFRGCSRPIILPLSNPTNKAEAVPDDLLGWTDGAALVGTGSPFPAVHLRGTTYEIGQANNVFAFPGIGLGASVVGARRIPDEVFSAAARAVHASTAKSTAAGAPIYPPISSLRAVSRNVAIAVARAVVDAGAAPPITACEIEDRVAAAMWEPVYLEYRYVDKSERTFRGPDRVL